MTGTYADIAAVIEALPERNRSGSLKIWGAWFGRPMDNYHICQSCVAEEDYITLRFDKRERLRVWVPSRVVTRGYTLIIETASKVRWEWYYYGRPQLSENLMFNEYERQGECIAYESNWMPGVETSARAHNNAVELIGE